MATVLNKIPFLAFFLVWIIMRLKTLFFCIAFFLIPVFSFANTPFTHRKDVQLFIEDMVRHYHFDQKQLKATLDQVVIQTQVLESMEKPYEKKNWDTYSTLFLTEQRINNGLVFWRNNQKLLERAQRQYGVPAEIIVAILGVETLYGTRQGEYRVLDALATLAFNYPKRSEFFTKELKEYLLLCQEQKRSATYFEGSYAGAIGQPQFMPSSYRHYAVDFNKKGKIDLVSDNGAAIGSVANYFQEHGWQHQEAVVQKAEAKGQGYKKMKNNLKYPNYTDAQLTASGIKPLVALHRHPNKVGLIELTTDKGNEYWIAYPNFFVIMHYNTSPQYALVVYLLAEQLKQQWNQMNSQKTKISV